MATRTWSGSFDSDLNNSANYDGSGALLTSDDLVFNTGGISATASASLSVNSVTTTSGYSGNWSISGYTLTVSGSVSFNHTGTLNMGNGFTLNGNSTSLYIGSVAGAYSAVGSSCNITFNGTGITFSTSKNFYFKSLTLGNSASASLNDAGYGCYIQSATGPLLTLGTNSTLTVGVGNQLRLYVTADMTVWSLGSGYTMNGTGSVVVQVSVSNVTVTVPGIVNTTCSYFMFTNSAYIATFNVTGDINVGSKIFYCQAVTANASENFTVNFNSSNITCGSMRHGVGTGLSVGKATLNYGSGSHTIDAFYASDTNSPTSYFNLQSSTWVCKGNWTFAATHVVNAGTSQITFNTNSANITLAGNSLYDVICNEATKTFTALDAFSCHNLTLAAGNWSNNASTITASGDANFNGTGTINLGTGITLNGTSSTFHIGSNVGTLTVLSCAIVMNTASAGVIDVDKINQFKTLTVNGVVSITGEQQLHCESNTTPFIMTAGSTCNLLTPLYLQPTASMNIWSLGTGYTITSTSAGSVVIYNHSGSYTISIPAFTATGLAQVQIANGGTGTGLVQFTGDLNIGTSLIVLLDQIGGNTFNFNNHNITCGIFRSGNNLNSLTTNFIYGSGTFTISSFDGATYNDGTVNENFQTSQWVCKGAWAYGSRNVITHAWDMVTCTNTASITSNGKTFNWLKINAPGKTVTLADNLLCRAYQNVGGTLNQNGKQFAVTGDYIQVTEGDV